MNTTTHFTDVFPIIPQAIPTLYAYTLLTDDAGNIASVGGKLSYCLRKSLDGCWVWTAGKLITDVPITPETIEQQLPTLWKNPTGAYQSLRHITPCPSWKPSPLEQAVFVAHGLLSDVHWEIQHVLDGKTHHFGKVYVERYYFVKGQSVNNTPALAVSVASHIYHKQNLAEYAAALDDLSQLKGLLVADIVNKFSAEVISVVGTVAEERARLLQITSTAKMRELIERAPDNEFTVQITTLGAEKNTYVYVASALRPVVRTGDMERMGINTTPVLAACRLSPTDRAALLAEVTDIIKAKGLIGEHYTSSKSPTIFLQSQDVGFSNTVQIGKGKVQRDNRGLMSALKQHGLYARSPKFFNISQPIRVGFIRIEQDAPTDFLDEVKQQLGEFDMTLKRVVASQTVSQFNTNSITKAYQALIQAPLDLILVLSPGASSPLVNGQELRAILDVLAAQNKVPSVIIGQSAIKGEKQTPESVVVEILERVGGPIRIGVLQAIKPPKSFFQIMQHEFQLLNFALKSVGVQAVNKLDRAHLERAITPWVDNPPDILLTLFPGQPQRVNTDGRETPYDILKSLTIGRGLMSQVVYQNTFDNNYAMDNIALGILGKTHNTTLILAEPLPYADMVVGIDVGRQIKRSLPGTINTTAIARIYHSNGEFLRYVIHDHPIEGETIPEPVLQRLFPIKTFQGKRVVIHRDGPFRGDERAALKNWATEIKAEFHLVEVIKSGTPRIYCQSGDNIGQPPKGTLFKLSETQAYLISSLPPFKNATPRPLHIQSESTFPIEKAAHSVLAMTLLHYGSVRAPRLPVTIHYSDKISKLAARGIKPQDLEGDVPFWL